MVFPTTTTAATTATTTILKICEFQAFMKCTTMKSTDCFANWWYFTCLLGYTLLVWQKSGLSGFLVGSASRLGCTRLSFSSGDTKPWWPRGGVQVVELAEVVQLLVGEAGHMGCLKGEGQKLWLSSDLGKGEAPQRHC